VDVAAAKLPELAAMAAKQWTAQFNPRPVGEAELLAIYRMAL
jgi:alcohol dehydrogenase